jgi:flagellar motor switch protein FliM
MIGQKFDQQWSLRKTEPTEAEQQRVLALIRTSDAELDARLRGPSLRVSDLLSMEEGDLLRFDHRLDQVFDCEINGKAKFRGRVINSNQKKAFLVEAMPETRG